MLTSSRVPWITRMVSACPQMAGRFTLGKATASSLIGGYVPVVHPLPTMAIASHEPGMNRVCCGRCWQRFNIAEDGRVTAKDSLHFLTAARQIGKWRAESPELIAFVDFEGSADGLTVDSHGRVYATAPGVSRMA